MHTLNKSKQRGAMPKITTLHKIASLYDVSVEYLTTGEDSYDDPPISHLPPSPKLQSHTTRDSEGVPYYDVTVMGLMKLLNPEATDTELEPAYYIDFKPFNRCDYYLRVCGDSMSPQYSSGDTIAIKRVANYEALLWGEPYVIICNDSANHLQTLRIIYQHEDQSKIILRSTNPKYPGSTVLKKSDIQVLFEVWGKIQRGRM